MRSALLDRLGVLGLACLLGGSCADSAHLLIPPEPPPLVRDGSPAQTDSLVYHLKFDGAIYDAWADVTLRNTSAFAVHYGRCLSSSTGPMYGMRRTEVDTLRRSFVGSAPACVGGVPTGVLAPSGMLTTRVWLGSTLSPFAQPPIEPGWRTGRFRIVFRLCQQAEADSDNCQAASTSSSQSNAFEVRLPQ